MPEFSKILVANRGEIACRVMRGARERGYRTVAVYSAADSDALHVEEADEAILIGPAPAAQSYLDIERILDAARCTGADAIHPGYGFLSERAAFAEACARAGIVFIGPDPEAIRVMGDKAESKRRMIAAGVPCIPGYQGEGQSDATFIAEADLIGYPVMVKASAGGGGRGMRIVTAPEGLADALRAARAEAGAAFGDDRLLLERAVIEPRHVEIQVFGDRHGNIVHLGERDCSIQRRHQKVVEEAPSPAVDPALRARMGAAAVQAAASIGYVGAGTVEFLLAADGAFYFLEMNTRLQVEHPVTELVTGLDLVGLQLDVAAGKPLPFGQDDVALRGHAIEVRLCAEDPASAFLPQTGPVHLWSPAEGEGVRIDHGIRAGTDVSPHYDSMIAKIIAWGADREEARRRLKRAVEDTAILGVPTNKAFLAEILGSGEFAAGEATTGFVARHYPSGSADAATPPAWVPVLAAALHSVRGGAGWRSNGWMAATVTLGSGRFSVRRDGEALLVSGEAGETRLEIIAQDEDSVRFDIGGHRRLARYAFEGATLWIAADGGAWAFADTTHTVRRAADEGAGGSVRAPMNGVVTMIDAVEGERVKRGQRIAVLEAMKMEHQILAPMDGVVETISAHVGKQVATRDILAIVRDGAAA
ncbi:MAG: acetyl-CoA carboxylase biotin carboxylase subunit [Sphingosinicella sp.]|nr:acetyl-CoA carboxylase biotin carboxylase subunit [Sphingosinicella sp.]